MEDATGRHRALVVLVAAAHHHDLLGNCRGQAGGARWAVVGGGIPEGAGIEPHDGIGATVDSS